MKRLLTDIPTELKKSLDDIRGVFQNLGVDDDGNEFANACLELEWVIDDLESVVDKIYQIV